LGEGSLEPGGYGLTRKDQGKAVLQECLTAADRCISSGVVIGMVSWAINRWV
jgi:hypothetical protein